MNAGKPRVVHGFLNVVGTQIQRVSPRAAIVAIAARLNRSKGGSA